MVYKTRVSTVKVGFRLVSVTNQSRNKVVSIPARRIALQSQDRIVTPTSLFRGIYPNLNKEV